MDPSKITLFGLADARGKRVPFGIKPVDRSKHMYVIGKTGMGKSTLLENMAIQDIQNGGGLAFIDPHGETAEKLLDYVPEHRIKDVVYFAPFDLQYPISFNVLEQVPADKRHFVVSGLMSTFEKIWADAWSARMSYILQNTIAALLEYPDATLLGINRMLIDKDFRKSVVESITDPGVKSFWVDEFAKYTERFAAEATPAIQNKVGQFGSNALIRNVIGQARSAVDFRKLMDEGKIVIINLSKGLVGENNAVLLGGMLITKIYLAAMSRADVTPEERKKLPAFNLYVDEFQSFANRSFANILSEARKYKLNLTIAHQYVEQMEEEVQAAVFGNVGTMIAFRVGATDAELLEKEFAPQFTAQDLVSLGFTQICLKLMIDGVSSAPFSALTMPPIPKPAVSFKGNVIHASRSEYARPRADVEQLIVDWHEKKFGAAPAPKPSSGAPKEMPKTVASIPPTPTSSTQKPFQSPRPEFRTEKREAPKPEVRQEATPEIKREIVQSRPAQPSVTPASTVTPPPPIQMPPAEKKQTLADALREATKEWQGEDDEEEIDQVENAEVIRTNTEKPLQKETPPIAQVPRHHHQPHPRPVQTKPDSVHASALKQALADALKERPPAQPETKVTEDFPQKASAETVQAPPRPDTSKAESQQEVRTEIKDDTREVVVIPEDETDAREVPEKILRQILDDAS